MIDDGEEARRRDDLDIAGPGRLAAAIGRADDAAALPRRRERRQQHAGDAGQGAVERHLAERGVAGQFVLRQYPHLAQQAERDRQVEMAAFLQHVGRRRQGQIGRRHRRHVDVEVDAVQ